MSFLNDTPNPHLQNRKNGQRDQECDQNRHCDALLRPAPFWQLQFAASLSLMSLAMDSLKAWENGGLSRQVYDAVDAPWRLTDAGRRDCQKGLKFSDAVSAWTEGGMDIVEECLWQN